MIQLAGRTFRRHGADEWAMESIYVPGAWPIVFGDNDQTIWEWRAIAQALDRLSTPENVECPTCHGHGGYNNNPSGWYWIDYCRRCGGTGSTAPENADEQTRRRCLENWPDAVSGEYHPLCCRFPKSCSIPPPENVEEPT